MNFVGIRKIREFDNLKYRALRIDWHTLNADIIDNIKSDCEKPSVNSFIVKTCKDSTAVVNWKLTTTSIHYGVMPFSMIDAGLDYEYILMNATHDPKQFMRLRHE